MEIPEHLLKRAQAARIKAGIEAGPEGDPRIPAHLLERSRLRAANPRLSSPAEGDPFAAKRQGGEDAKAKLLVAKANLIAAVQPVRRVLESVGTDLRGQFLNPDSLRIGASFTPRRDPKADAYFTVYGNRETFEEADGGKSLRIGEQRAWRMPVSKKDLGGLLRSTGQRPLIDTVRIASERAVFVEGDNITAELAARVFESATAERTTNSITLFEGEPDLQAYYASYGNRFAAGVSITRNPADTPEEESIFGVDFTSLRSSYRVDEGRPDDGSLYESERTVMAGFSFLDRKPSVEGFSNAFTATEVILGAFGRLLEEPSQANTLLVCQTIDKCLS